MKKILLLVAALLFSAASVFSQDYVVSLSWEHNECNCQDQGNSYYAVKVVIYDDANDVTVVTGTEVRVDFGTYSVDVSVPEVNQHCDDPNLQYTPSYTVWAGVAVMCDDTNPPEAVCNTGNNSLTGKTCTDFENNNVGFTYLTFN